MNKKLDELIEKIMKEVVAYTKGSDYYNTEYGNKQPVISHNKLRKILKKHLRNLTEDGEREEEGGYANDGQYIKIDYYCMSCGTHITNKMGCPNSNCRGKVVLF